MADNKIPVLFAKGLSSVFENMDKDPNTIYFLTDTHEIYQGSTRYSIGRDIQIVISGEGDTVVDCDYSTTSRELTFKLGTAGELDSVTSAIKNALNQTVASVTADNDSAIKVDNTDPRNPKLSLKFHDDAEDTPGNVKFHQDIKGLWATVEDVPVEGVAAGDKILKLSDKNKELSATLSIAIEKQGDKNFIILKGVDGQEISKVDATDFIRADLLKSAALNEKVVDGKIHKFIDLEFYVEDDRTSQVSVDVQDLVDIYEAAADGGLVLDENKNFAIKNSIEAYDGESDIPTLVNKTIHIPFVAYDKHGLITKKKSVDLTLPQITGGSIGDYNKLLTSATLDEDGKLSGQTVDLVSKVTEDSTDREVPTARSVYDAVHNVSPSWTFLSDGQTPTPTPTPTKKVDTEDVSTDMKIAFSKSNSFDLDLADGTLTGTVDEDGHGLAVPEGKTLTISNGTLDLTQNPNKGTTYFSIKKNGSLVLDNVYIKGAQSIVMPDGNAASVTIKDSTIETSGYYGFSTNASVDNDSLTYGSDFTINIENSTIITHNDENDNAAVLVNVPCNLTITGSHITGDRQGLFIRAGHAIVKDSDIKVTGTYSNPTQYHSGVWKSGNEVPSGAIIVGNFAKGTSTTYPADAILEISNTKISGTNDVPAVYVDSNDTYKASAVLSECTVTGAITKGRHDAASDTKTTTLVVDGVVR